MRRSVKLRIRLLGTIKFDGWGDVAGGIKRLFHPIVQILVVILFSLLPLLLTAGNVASHNVNKHFFSELSTLLESGSMFIYVSTFLAPYFYSLFFEGGFRARLNVMGVLLLAIWSLVMGALLYSGFVNREWGGDSFPYYIEWSVLLPALFTWYYTLYGSVGGSSQDPSKQAVEDAIKAGVNNR